MTSKKNTAVCLALSVVLLMGGARYAEALPDLVVTYFNAPTTVVIGNWFQIGLIVRNQGDAAAGPFRVGFYFSTDATVTKSDIFSGSWCDYLSGLAVGEEINCTGQIWASAISPGTYYFGAIADDQGVIAESNENNNTRNSNSGTITLTSSIAETVSTPNTPTGPNTGTTGTSYNYSTGGAISSQGHPVQYLFNWGDGTDSGWLAAGTTTASKSWGSANTYQVKTQARCATHNTVLSSLSGILNVTINAPPETVSAPNTPTGPVTAILGMSYNYSTGGATSSLGHSIQYLFNWGDGTDSGWLPVGTTSAPKAWSSSGSYPVMAQVRCSTDTSILSSWSGILNVTVNTPATETISTPNVPVGPNSGTTGTSYTYATGGATSSQGHPVEYFFNWGDGTNSGWLPVGTTSAPKSWTSPASYPVMAQARCATDTSIVSSWSNVFSVTISDNVDGPNLTGSWTRLTQSCRYIAGTPKCRIIGTLQIDNTGNQDSSPASLDYYISTDGNFDPGDTPLKSVTIGKIKAKKARRVTFSYNLPEGEMATGEYFVAVIGDYNLIIVSAQVP